MNARKGHLRVLTALIADGAQSSGAGPSEAAVHVRPGAAWAAPLWLHTGAGFGKRSAAALSLLTIHETECDITQRRAGATTAGPD